MKNRNIMGRLLLFLVISILAACSGNQTTPGELNEYDQRVKEINREIGLEPIELTTYSKEIGLTLASPKHKKFAVNQKVVIEGKVKEHAKLKSNYAWVKVYADEVGPAGAEHEYYMPINGGQFKETIHFFNGDGEYRVEIKFPSTEQEDYYYSTASFEVINVHPDMQRDVTYTPFGIEAGLSLQIDDSYATEKALYPLKGEVEHLSNNDTIMIILKKDSQQWKHLLPIKDGKFSYDVPLYYGKGLHELQVLVPEGERDDYYQLATTILINNESSRIMDPIEFTMLQIERGINVDYPLYSGEEGDTTFPLKGSIDPNATFAKETTHLYVKAKKGEDESLEVIPVENYVFDDSFHLRFGPGTYEVTVNVPEITEKNEGYFQFFGVAKFEVKSTASKDQRDILPSLGVPSEHPKIQELAKEITRGKNTDAQKAKSIYTYVAKNIAYDVDKFKNNSFSWDDGALKTLQLKSGVCQDYAYLTIALLRASGIEARFIVGQAGDGTFGSVVTGDHAWVEAKVDGSWLIMDPTWGAGYVEGDRFVPRYTEKYFNPVMNKFNRTHTRIKVNY